MGELRAPAPRALGSVKPVQPNDAADAERPVTVARPKSGSRIPSRVPAQYLRRHAEGPQERTTHAFAVHETCFLRHDIDRVPSLFDHEPGGLQPEPLHGFCRRLAGLAQKGAAELAGAEVGDCGERRPLTP